jgi:predicted ABC-type ATPase
VVLSHEELQIEADALAYAKQHKKEIARRHTDPAVFLPEEEPVSVFMAGSPGAGKTEASIELIEKLDGPPIIRIDLDELRAELPGYTGQNAYLFQKGAAVLLDRIHDLALDQGQSFLLDGTFARYDIARRNIERSLKRKRYVQILYVYQEPLMAWQFVRAREASEGRRVLPELFVEQYFAAREVVNRIKEEFGKAIHVDLLIKNIDNSNRSYKAGVDRIDHHIPEKHSRTDVEKLLGLS